MENTSSHYCKRTFIGFGLFHQSDYVREIQAGCCDFFREKTGEGMRVLSYRTSYSMYTDIQKSPLILGAIVYANHYQMWRNHDGIPSLAEWQIPLVNTSNRFERRILPTVVSDDAQIGRLAAEHLINRGKDTLWVYGPEEINFAVERTRAFIEKAKAEGGRAQYISDKNLTMIAGKPSWFAKEEVLELLLKEDLEKAGVFCTTDEAAFKLAQAAYLHTPKLLKTLSMVTVRNDPSICDMGWERVGIIDPNPFEIGRHAAELMLDIVKGKKIRMEYRIPPSPVIGYSAAASSANDPQLEKAMAFIMTNLHRSIGVDEIAAQAGVCRRTLDRKMQERYGHPTFQRIHLIRLEKARQVLVSTCQPLAEIAEMVGFSSDKRLSEAFRKYYNLSPSQFRNRKKGKLSLNRKMRDNKR